MNDPKRQEIKDRIAASQARQTSRAGTSAGYSSTKESDFVAFARDHPVLTVAGGLAVGILIAGLFPSARKAARKSGKRAGVLGAAGTQAAVSFLQHLADTGEDAGRAGTRKLSDLGDTLSDTARSAGREAHILADRSTDSARVASREAGKALSRSFHRLFG